MLRRSIITKTNSFPITQSKIPSTAISSLRHTRPYHIGQIGQRMFPHARAYSTLKIDKLICHASENFPLRKDAVRISIWGNEFSEHIKEMRKGDTKDIKAEVKFDDNAHILLAQRNDVLANSLIDFKTITEAPSSNSSLHFKPSDNSSHYEIIYTVTNDPTDPPANTSNQKSKIELKSIVCIKKEEEVAKDNLLLKVENGAAINKFSATFAMSRLDIFHVYKMLPFDYCAYVTLMEEDQGFTSTIDPDDELGTQIVSAKRVNNALLDFKENGAFYRLIYSVKPQASNERLPSPIFIVPKEQMNSTIGIWVGGFNRLTEAMDWEVTAVNGNEPIKKGTINAWKHAQPVKEHPNAVVSYDNIQIPLDEKLFKPDTTYRILTRYGTNGLQREGQFRTLPKALPVGESKALDVLLGSCYEHTFDKGRTVETFKSLFGNVPHIKAFTGDQVYLDHPALQHISARYSDAELAVMFHQRYHNVWHSLRGMHSYGNNYFMADDHDIFNGYPFKPVHMIGRMPPNYLETWASIAKTYYNSLQATSLVTTITLGDDISFCMAEFRTQRDKECKNLMPDNEFNKVINWLQNLKSPGVLVMGQPILAARGGIMGYLDKGAEDYQQFETLVKQIADSKHDIVVLAGDVHFSRLAEVKLNSGKTLYEIITSPMSLVELTDGLADAGISGINSDSSETFSAGIWTAVNDEKGKQHPDAEPKQFPQDFIKTTQSRFPIDYKKAGTGKIQPDPKDPKKEITSTKRTEENFSRLRFFKKDEKSKDVTLKVETYMLRQKDKQTDNPRLDWNATITLRRS